MGHISGVAAFFIIVAFGVVGGAIAWVIYTQIRARRLGLPRPTLQAYNPFNRGTTAGRYSGPGGSSSSGGVFGWIRDKLPGARNRSGTGAAEPLSGNSRGRGGRRGFGPLDPDEAWDARVGNEADAYGPGGYYEEQELGLHPGDELARGRTLNRDLAPQPYAGASNPSSNPFDDGAEPSNVGLRGVSPRPLDTVNLGKDRDRHDGSGDSPGERRSIFHEDV